MNTKECVLILVLILIVINFFAFRYLLIRTLQPIIDRMIKAEAESDLVSFMIHEKVQSSQKSDLK